MIYISDSKVQIRACLEIGLPTKTVKRRKAKLASLPLMFVETGLDVISELPLEILGDSADFLSFLENLASNVQDFMSPEQQAG